MGPEGSMDCIIARRRYGCTKMGLSSSAPWPCLLVSQGSKVEAFAGRNSREKDEARVSNHDAMISRSAQKSCRIALEMADVTVDGLPGVMLSEIIDLDVFGGRMQRARDCRELAQCEGEHMNVADGY